ncbi:MAG: hypothetical protein Q4C87_03330 [Actinomycetaceae bacterium]|nr:hypothetical protein [Actinomycetaceae bacterium]
MLFDASIVPDTLVTAGNIDLFWLLAALAGGAFGAMIGANYAFAFTGVSILIGLGIAGGTGSSLVLDYVAFGPAWGPHVAFAGGVAAATYAAKKGYMEVAKDINAPLVGLGKPDVLLVGAVWGAGGYIFQKLITLIPWFGTNTDAVALTVVTSGILVRVVYGKTPVLHALTPPSDEARWLKWQETPGQLFTVSAFASLFAAGIATILVGYVAPNAPDPTVITNNAQALPFAFSSICIFFVAAGMKWPVTHHITITAGLAAAKFLPIVGNGFAAVLIGIVFGVIAGFACEYFARFFFNHGDTHIDPPAGIIWFMNTAVVGIAGLLAA